MPTFDKLTVPELIEMLEKHLGQLGVALVAIILFLLAALLIAGLAAAIFKIVRPLWKQSWRGVLVVIGLLIAVIIGLTVAAPDTKGSAISQPKAPTASMVAVTSKPSAAAQTPTPPPRVVVAPLPAAHDHRGRQRAASPPVSGCNITGGHNEGTSQACEFNSGGSGG